MGECQANLFCPEGLGQSSQLQACSPCFSCWLGVTDEPSGVLKEQESGLLTTGEHIYFLLGISAVLQHRAASKSTFCLCKGK